MWICPLHPGSRSRRLPAPQAVRCGPNSIHPVQRRRVVAPPYQQDYRARYLSASLGNRVAIAQLIGEEGVERYAEGRGLKTLLSPLGRSTPIGPDSVFRNPLSGRVQVLEAKGGSSALKWTYGSLQGTNANAIRSAGGVLAHSGANWSEKLQAARVIKAAQSGHLETGVIRTSPCTGNASCPETLRWREFRQCGERGPANRARLGQTEIPNWVPPSEMPASSIGWTYSPIAARNGCRAATP